MTAAVRDYAIAAAALVVVTAVAELLGATNLGTALTFGVIAFIAVIVGAMLRRNRADEPAAAPGEERSAARSATAKPPPPPPRRRRR